MKSTLNISPLRILFLITAVAVVFTSCKTLRELKALSKCAFRIESVTNTRLVGIDIQSLTSFSKLGVADAAKATAGFISGRLPLDFTLNLQVKNPNKQKAALNKFDWIALIDNGEILNGTVNRRMEVEPGGTGTLPLNISVNLKEVVNKLTKRQMLDYPFGLSDGQKKPTRVALKLKPTIMVGS
ncbi:MAG: hypothetical protein AAF570_10710, partial [Bacteroidota bacterium]